MAHGETTAYDDETPHRTVAISDDQPHPVSEPISGLTADTTYHFQICVEDGEEDPPRVVCSSDQAFTTGATAGSSAIAFTTRRDGDDDEVYSMDADGGNQIRLTNHAGPDRSGLVAGRHQDRLRQP